jgi:hypothetical protein
VVTIPMATSAATLGQLGRLGRLGKLHNLPLIRCSTGGSKQTRTGVPLLVSYRHRVRCRSPVFENPYL